MRLVYLSMYFAQVLVAALIGALVAALAPGEPRPNAFLGWVLVALALLQLPLGLAAASRLGRVTSRQAALSRTLLTAVTLSSGAWFAALAVGTGQRGASVLLLLGLLVAAYALGFFTTGRLAGAAAALPPEGKAPADAPAYEGQTAPDAPPPEGKAAPDAPPPAGKAAPDAPPPAADRTREPPPEAD